MPYNLFDQFKKACKEEKEIIFPINNVSSDAKKNFKLHTKTALLEFIENDGLENLEPVNIATWAQSPGETVYAYKFRTMNILGYIAIIKAKKTGNWLIKSFHPSDDSSDKMKIAFQKAGLLDNRSKK